MNICRAGGGTDTILAGAGDDVIDLGRGVQNQFQYAYGQAGNDTYLYGTEQGLVYISSSAETASSGTNDTVYFKDLNLSDITVSTYDYTKGSTLFPAEGVALRLMWSKNGKSGELRIANQGKHIEKFVFADGSSVKSITGDYLPYVYPGQHAGRLDDRIEVVPVFRTVWRLS